MTSERERLDVRLSRIERTLAELEARLEMVEMGSLPQPALVAAAPGRAPAAASRTDVAGTLALIGRTFVIVAGAYLLRALTEADLVDRNSGAAIGMAYAVSWTAVAYRVRPRRTLSATFFGACTVLIGFPLLWEATTRFALLTPTAGAWALTATTAIVLVAAWRRHLHALAWFTTIVACVLASVLMVMTGGAVPFTTFLIALGVAALWLGYDREWTKLRWVAAFFADLAVLALIGRALATPPRDAPSQVMAVQLLLLVGYLGSIAIRTLVRDREVVPFEAVQTGAMLLVGLAGALIVAHRTGAGTLTLGPALLALAVVCYAVASAPRWRARSANYTLYTSLGLVFALTGAELVLDGTPLSLLWVSLALLVGWAGRRYGRPMLTVHSVVYVTAAAISSGLFAASLAGLLASVDHPWTPIRSASWAALAGLGVCWGLSTRSVVPARFGVDLLRLTLAILIAVSMAGACVILLRALLPSASATLEAAIVATWRTGVLSATALIVAWLGRHVTAREFGFLLYPALGWGGLKLLIEDFRTSPPLLLVVAFALYGGALILAPRIAKTGRQS